jgi:hypothetical protein
VFEILEDQSAEGIIESLFTGCRLEDFTVKLIVDSLANGFEKNRLCVHSDKIYSKL